MRGLLQLLAILSEAAGAGRLTGPHMRAGKAAMLWKRRGQARRPVLSGKRMYIWRSMKVS